MAEIPQVEESDKVKEVVIPVVEDKKPDEAKPDGDKPQKTNADYAKERLDQEKADLKQRVTDLEAKLKDASRSQLSEEDQLEADLKDFSSERIQTTLAEDLKLLPEKLQQLIQKNPWHFVDQADLDSEVKGSTNRVEAYKRAEKLAVRSIKELIDGVKTEPVKKEEEQKDPTIPIGKIGADGSPAQYSEAELWIMRQREPEKFGQIQSTIKKMK